MTRIVVGASTVAALSVLAALAFWVLWPNEALTAKAAVTQACSSLAATDSFDMRLVYETETRLGTNRTIVQVEYQGDLKRRVEQDSMAGVSRGFFETIEDFANQKIYYRIGTEPWKVRDIEYTSGFPHTKESLCPDLANASVTFVAEETLGGVNTRKYSYETETKLNDWFFWIDANGWLIKVESTKLGARAARTAQSGGAELRASATISGRGEANTITIPSVGQ